MNDALIQAFTRLELSTGKPDPQARKAALVSFVQGGLLNVNELRLLKELLSTVALQKDVVPNLPVELVILITDFLSEKDITSCLVVSRAWNATFMSDQVVFSLADRFFPQLTWQASNHHPQGGHSRTELRQNFLQSIRNRVNLLRRSGPGPGAFCKFDNGYVWDSETEFALGGQEYSQFPPPNLPFNQKALYFNGRIAWQRETHTLVIDNLRDRSRKILSFPGGKLLGPEMKLAALGDRLVVATMDRHLFAWEIDTNKFERKTMPNMPARCTTSGDSVAVITDKEIYVWKMGGSLLAMSLPDLDVDLMAANQFPKAFVHPYLENVVFARQLYRNSSLTLRFMVHKFVDRKHVQTFTHDVQMSWFPTERMNSSFTGFIPLSSYRDEEGFFLHEFDMWHEKFSRRNIPYGGKHHTETFMFTIDDDYAVELSERHYWVW